MDQQKQSSRGVLRKRYSEKCSNFKGEHPCLSAILNILKIAEIVNWKRAGQYLTKYAETNLWN